MGGIGPQSSRRLRTSGFHLHTVSQVQRIAVLLSQREHGPCETPSPFKVQVMILLSVELTLSEAGTSLMHGTKAENVDCSIHRSCPLTLPLSSPEDTWQGTRSAGAGAPLSLQTEREHSGSLEGCQVGSQSPLSSTLKLTRCLKSTSSRSLLSHRTRQSLGFAQGPSVGKVEARARPKCPALDPVLESHHQPGTVQSCCRGALPKPCPV